VTVTTFPTVDHIEPLRVAATFLERFSVANESIVNIANGVPFRHVYLTIEADTIYILRVVVGCVFRRNFRITGEAFKVFSKVLFRDETTSPLYVANVVRA